MRRPDLLQLLNRLRGQTRLKPTLKACDAPSPSPIGRWAAHEASPARPIDRCTTCEGAWVAPDRALSGQIVELVRWDRSERGEVGDRAG